MAFVLILALRPFEPQEPLFPNVDKAKHLLAFTALYVLGIWAGVRPWVLAMGLLAYGGAIEVLQGMTPTRQASWGDWFADAAGIMLGFAIGRWAAGRMVPGFGRVPGAAR